MSHPRANNDWSALRSTLRSLVEERTGVAGHHIGAIDVDRFAAIAQFLPEKPARILDVGCGLGVLSDVMASMGHDVLGVDTDASALGVVQSANQLASIDDLPFPDRSFDVVIASEILEHLPVESFQRARNELARVSARAVLVTVPNAESLESASTRCPDCKATYSIHGHVRRFVRDDMSGLIPGYDLSAIRHVGPFKLRHRSLEWVIRRRMLGRWPIQPGARCPQCLYVQPGRPTGGGADPSLALRVARLIAAAPWQRWWMVAMYARNTDDEH